MYYIHEQRTVVFNQQKLLINWCSQHLSILKINEKAKYKPYAMHANLFRESVLNYETILNKEIFIAHPGSSQLGLEIYSMSTFADSYTV